MKNIVTVLIKKIKLNEFSLNDLELVKSISANELVEILKLEDLSIRNFLIKAYFTTYDESTVELAYDIFDKTYKILAEIWASEALYETSEDLASGLLTITYLNSNFVSNIRANIIEEKLNDFESQTYKFLEYLKTKRIENNLIYTIFGSGNMVSIPNKKDDELLNLMPEETKSMLEKIISDLDFLNMVWEYYILVANNQDSQNILDEIKKIKNKKDLVKKMLPESIFKKLEPIFTYEKEFRFSEIIGSEFKFENKRDVEEYEDLELKSEIKSEIKSDSLSNFFDKFKKNKKIEVKPERNFVNENFPKRRNSIHKAPKKRGNGKIIVVSVLIMLAISVGIGSIVHKSTITKDEPIQNAILKDGLKANVTVNEVKTNKEENIE